MAANFSVFTTFKAKDQVSKKFDKMGKNARKFGRDSKSSFGMAGKAATSFGSVLSGVLGASAITGVFSKMSEGLSAVTSEFIDFDHSITASSAKFKGLDLTTAAGQKTLEKLKKSARETGAETQHSATAAALSLDFYATAGFTAEQAMTVLTPTAKLATVANLDLARTSDIASDALGIFQLQTKDSAQLQKNFARLTDVMSKTMTSSNTSIEDMFEAMKSGGATFKSTGQDLETFNALVGVMANSGKKGGEAGTTLRNIMARLAKPTGEAQNALELLGVATRDQNGNFRDAFDILGDMEKGFEGMGNAQKAAALKTVFGEEAITGVTLILNEGTENLRKYRDELKNSSGATEQMAQIMGGSIKNQMASLKSAAIEVGFQFVSQFAGNGVSAIQKLTEFIRGVNVQPLVDGIRMVTGGISWLVDRVTAVGESSGAFDKIKNAVMSLQPVFSTLVDIVKTVYGFLNDAGFVDIFVQAFGIIGDLVSVTAKIFVKMWEVVKPILTGFLETLKPMIQGVAGVFKVLGKITGGVNELLGGDEAGGQATQPQAPTAPQRVAPNAVEVEARQSLNFQGEININGAPQGSTASTTRRPGAPAVKMNLIGASG